MSLPGNHGRFDHDFDRIAFGHDPDRMRRPSGLGDIGERLRSVAAVAGLTVAPDVAECLSFPEP
jgi:hypothetical protein